MYEAIYAQGLELQIASNSPLAYSTNCCGVHPISVAIFSFSLQAIFASLIFFSEHASSYQQF